MNMYAYINIYTYMFIYMYYNTVTNKTEQKCIPPTTQ